MTDASDLLAGVPDWHDPNFRAWLGEGVAAARRCGPGAEVASLAGRATEDGLLGPLLSASWRATVACALLADWACYEADVDRVELPRLAFVMSRFPQGFRLWFARTEGRWWPVGYTGWYPVAPSLFLRLERGAEDLQERMIVPTPAPSPSPPLSGISGEGRGGEDDADAPGGEAPSPPLSGISGEGRGGEDREAAPYLYLFNYSIAPGLRRTAQSRALMRAYAADLASAGAAGAVAIVVSEDGLRIASRFGLREAGRVRVPGGPPEAILVGRWGS